MTKISERFRKNERLCSRKTIEELFSNGKSFYCQSFQVIWNHADDTLQAPARIAVSVPKKNFRSAVQRNRIRRKIREAYRHRKHVLYENLEKSGRRIVFMIIFKGSTEPDYNELFQLTGKIISILTEQITSANGITE